MVSKPGERNAAGYALDLIRAEARYRRERRDLYAARLYSGRPATVSRLDELTREAKSAQARLVLAEKKDHERIDERETQ